MSEQVFGKESFRDSLTLKKVSDKHVAGQVTIVGGSKLFHGAPLVALKACSRIVGMVYFASPSADRKIAEKIKSELFNFIWVPRREVGEYITKSDVVLIGPGMMRNRKEKDGFACDNEGIKTRELCLELFNKFPNKQWVVDGGALQVLKIDEIPKRAVITPNSKEFMMLFDQQLQSEFQHRSRQVEELAKKYDLVILTKDSTSIASDGETTMTVKGGNIGLIKGATGDAIAGVLSGFLARDKSVYAAAAASFLVNKAAEKLAEKVGYMFNADDLVNTVPSVYGEIINSLVE